MTASMGSSNHVFFTPRAQLNLHVAQTSMWLLDVRSPRWDAECPGHLQSNAARRCECVFFSESLICDCQIGLFSMNITRGSRHVGILQASVVVILIHGLENVNGVCSVLCLCRPTALAQSTTFSAAPVKNDRSVIEACRRCQFAVTGVGVSRTLFLHLRSPHAAVLLLDISGLAR